MHNTIRTKPARRSLPKLGRAGADVFAALAKKTKYVEPSLADHWPTIAGAEIANLCRPGRLTGPRQGRALEIYATSGADAAKLQYLLDDLKNRLNGYLGPGVVGRIVIKQIARKAAPPARTDGETSSLDAALASFRRSVGEKSGNS